MKWNMNMTEKTIEEDESQNEEIKFHLFAPFKIIKIEFFYLSWIIFVIFFGLFDLWFGVLNADWERVKSTVANGTLYTFSISICIPFIVEFCLSWLLDKQNYRQSKFVRYKVFAIIIDTIFTTIMTILWLGNAKNNTLLQIIICILAIIFAFYMYCVERMPEYDHLSIFDDNYLASVQKNMYDKTQKSKKTDSIKGAKA